MLCFDFGMLEIPSYIFYPIAMYKHYSESTKNNSACAYEILIKQMPAVSLIRQGGSVKYTIIFYPTRFGYGSHGLHSAPKDDVTFIQ